MLNKPMCFFSADGLVRAVTFTHMRVVAGTGGILAVPNSRPILN